MATDDRDTDSPHPSKSFKVGEFDRLSGFFTPVWESKRRLRAESPIPSSSAAASAPSSARGADKDKAAASRPSSPPSAPPARRSSPPPAPARRPSSPPAAHAAQAAPAAVEAVEATAAAAAAAPPRRSSPPPAGSAQRPSSLPPARRASTPPAAAEPAQRPSTPAPEPAPKAERSRHARGSREARAGAKTVADASPPAGEQTPRVEAEVDRSRQDAPSMDPADDGVATLAPGAWPVGGAARAASSPPPPAVSTAATDDPSEGDARVAAALHAAAAVTVRPVIPMPTTQARPAARYKTPASSPSPAVVSSHPGDAQPGTGALPERQPEPRASAERRGTDLRSARAAAAATALHDKLRTKLVSDSVDTFARHRETESEREALQAAAARAAATPADPHSGQVLRQLRRTIHLSTPLPEPVRQMLEKYRY